MNINTPQKVAIGIGILTLIAAYGKKKYDDYSNVIENLQFKISSISKVNVKGLSLFFDISVKFYNPTDQDFFVDSLGLVAVKKVRVFRKGIFIGEANSDITAIEIPAGGTTEIKGIPIETKYLSFLSEITNLASLTEMKDYTLEIIVEALGQSYVIEQPMMVAE